MPARHAEEVGGEIVLRDELADRLRDEGLPVFRLWSYLEVGAVTEELANELAERLRNELPEDADVWVWANPDDLPFWTKPLPL